MTNRIHWVLQANLIKPAILDQIKRVLIEDKIDFEEVMVIPFSNELPEIKNKEGLFVFYGSTTLILNALQNPIYASGVFMDAEKFNLQNYLLQWKHKMLNYDSIFCSLAEFITHDYLGESEWFLRPIGDDKSFSGTLMDFKGIQKMAENLKNSNNSLLNADTRIAFSSPKEIEKEWRHFIVDRKIVSTSRYRMGGETSISSIDIPDALINFVNQCIEEYIPHPIFVMDTALSNGTYYIIECNCFNGTGFYQHDIPSIIREVNKYIGGV